MLSDDTFVQHLNEITESVETCDPLHIELGFKRTAHVETDVYALRNIQHLRSFCFYRYFASDTETEFDDTTNLAPFLEMDKGIQGSGNSSLTDAAIVAIFAFNSAFDLELKLSVTSKTALKIFCLRNRMN